MDNVPRSLSSVDYRRLQDIEQRVIESIITAADVIDELANMGDADRVKLTSLCQQYMNNVKTAQALVKEAVLKSTAERNFEVNVYQAMARSYLTAEKVKVLSMHLEDAAAVFKESTN